MSKAKKIRGLRFKNYFKSYNFLGTLIGAVFVYLGFLPSLLPRGWVLQAVLGAVLFVIGYSIGLVLSHNQTTSFSYQLAVDKSVRNLGYLTPRQLAWL